MKNILRKLKTETIAIDSDGRYNPYLASRIEWDERFGPAIKNAHNWQKVAFGALLTILLQMGCIGFLLYRAKHVAPYVAVVDSATARVVAEGSDVGKTREQQMVENALASWIEDARLVTTDAELQKRATLRSLHLMKPGSAAYDDVVAWWKADPPPKRAEKATVTAEVTSRLRIGDSTYEITWEETERFANETRRRNWKAALKIVLQPPDDNSTIEAVRNDPLGLFITEATWAQVDKQ